MTARKAWCGVVDSSALTSDDGDGDIMYAAGGQYPLPQREHYSGRASKRPH